MSNRRRRRSFQQQQERSDNKTRNMEDDDDEDDDTKSLNKRRGNGRNDVGQGMRKEGRYREREETDEIAILCFA